MSYYPKVGEHVLITVPIVPKGHKPMKAGTVKSRDGEYFYIEPDGHSHEVELYACELAKDDDS